MESLRPGQTIGHLRIEREVGRGGFAVVYLAEDTRLRRKVALKLLHSPMQRGASADEYGAFLDEARVVASLESPHVVTLYSLQETDQGSLMLEMEWVPGGTLDGLLVEGGLGAERTEALLRDMLEGLASAHEGGVLHRDVKPANILIMRDGKAKLTDFGLARVAEEEPEIGEGILGTPYYMAPELLRQQPATVQSDLWSVGVLAHEMLTGARPFTPTSAVSFFVAVQNEEPAVLPHQVPPRLRTLVARCLDKEPGRRPASCREALALLDPRGAHPAEAEPAPPRTSTFEGRVDELRRIEAALGERTLLVTGSAGIGKSALVEEAARRARGKGFLWIDARLATVEGPLVTLVEAVRRVVPSSDGQITSAFGPDGRQVMAILRGDEIPALENRQQALWVLQNLLQGVAHARPLVLSVDDAQNASEEDVGLLEDLARRFHGQPFTLLVATRPATHVTTKLSEARRLDLRGLDEEALFAFLEARLEATLPGDVVARIHARTEGNPLHAIELVRHLEGTGALARRSGRLVTTPRWAHETVPAQLRDVVHARLASLDGADRALLEVAAVDGPEFDGRAVAAVQDLPVLQVLQTLQALSRTRTLIEPASHGYRFANRLTQEVLYEDMAPELRVELHRALAEHLEARGTDVEPARLARHWERCGERARAAPYLLQVAESAQGRQELRRLLAFSQRAGLLEEPPLVDLGEHADLALVAASSLLRSGRSEESDALYERLLRTADQREDRVLAERIALHRATARLVNGRRPPEDDDTWQGVAERQGESMRGAHAHAVIGRLAKLDGKLERAREAFERADVIYRKLDSEWHHSMIQDELGSVAMRENRLDDARACYAVAAEIAEGIGLSSNAAVSRMNAALAQMSAGDIDGLDEDLHRAVRTFELLGSTGPAAHVRIFLAEAVFAHGRSAGALEVIEVALPDLEHMRNRRVLANAHRLRAELLHVADRLEEAAQAIEPAIDHAGVAGDRTQLLVAYGVKALIAASAGRMDDASCAVEALDAADPDGTIPADGAVLALAEAVLYGLPPDTLEAVGRLARSEQEQHLLRATLACARGEPCEAALAELAACPIGLRRATYRLLTAWLTAEGARRTGNTSQQREAAAAREAATALGHARALRSLDAREAC